MADGSVSQAANDQLNDAQNDLSQAKDHANKAQNTANQADQHASDAQKDVGQAKNNVNDATKAQSDAQAKADAAQKAQDASQKALDDASQHQQNQNQVHLSQGYIDALNAYSQASPNDANYQQVVKTLITATNNEWAQNGGYVSNANDQAIKINSKADLDKYMAELNTYAQQLVNNVRDQFGTSQVQVSNGSKQVGQQIGNALTDENWNSLNGHDMNVNRNVAQANGLSQLSDQDMNVVMDKVLSKSWNLSLDDFKKALYEAMQNYLFNGVEWNHATSVAGTRLGAKGKDVWMGLG